MNSFNPALVETRLSNVKLGLALEQLVHESFVVPVRYAVQAEAVGAFTANRASEPTLWTCQRLWPEARRSADSSSWRHPVTLLEAPVSSSRFACAAKNWIGFELVDGRMASLIVHSQSAADRSLPLSSDQANLALVHYEQLFDHLSLLTSRWSRFQFRTLRDLLNSAGRSVQRLRHRLTALESEWSLLELTFASVHQASYSARLRAASAYSVATELAIIATEFGLALGTGSDRIEPLVEQARASLYYLEPFATSIT